MERAFGIVCPGGSGKAPGSGDAFPRGVRTCAAPGRSGTGETACGVLFRGPADNPVSEPCGKKDQRSAPAAQTAHPVRDLLRSMPRCRNPQRSFRGEILFSVLPGGSFKRFSTWSASEPRGRDRCGWMPRSVPDSSPYLRERPGRCGGGDPDFSMVPEMEKPAAAVPFFSLAEQARQYTGLRKRAGSGG